MDETTTPRRPMNPVGIRGIGHELPARCLTNSDLVQLGSPVTPEWISVKTGIETRYVADDGIALSDLVIPAAVSALASAQLMPGDLDAIVVSGDLHDSGGVQLTSTVVSEALGISGITCLDLRAGCPSSVMVLSSWSPGS